MANDKIDLFQNFYNKEKLLVSQMDDTALRLHREELSKLVLEARAYVSAADDEDRERRAKRSPDGKSWLVSSDLSPNVTDALDATKERKKRMSKADKLLEDMKKLGISDDVVSTMISNVEKANSGGSVVTSHNREMKDSGIIFNKPDVKNINTHESLAASAGSLVVEGITSGYKEEQIVEAVVTSAHSANNILGRPWLKDTVIVEESNNETPKNFDPSKLFG